jgi:fatty acid desaturase
LYVMVRESFGEGQFRQKFYRYYLLEFILIYGLVIGFFLIHPIKAFFYFGLMYSLVYTISRHVDYITHVSSHSESDYAFANVCLHPKYNKLLWNFGYHIAHHLEPRAHWTTLPTIYRGLDLQQDSPSASIVNYFGVFLPGVFYWHKIKQAEPHQ